MHFPVGHPSKYWEGPVLLTIVPTDNVSIKEDLVLLS